MYGEKGAPCSPLAVVRKRDRERYHSHEEGGLDAAASLTPRREREAPPSFTLATERASEPEEVSLLKRRGYD